VRVRILSATIVAGLLIACTLAGTAQAQQQQPAGENAGIHASRYGIAVVDISYIFKNYKRFKGQMDQMKADVQAAEQALLGEREAIQKMVEQLKSLYKPGTPEYKKMDDQIAERKAEFTLKATKQRKEILEREAKIYYQAYLEVNDAVKYYALRNNIGLVLRFNGDPIDPNNRQHVLRAINKPVVFQNGIDITPDILKTLDRSQGRGQDVGQRGQFQVPGRQ